MVAQLSWATWAIRSRSLISSERLERFAHSCSFVLINLSKSLAVAHLIWAKWANEQMSKWAMRNEQIPSPAKILWFYAFRNSMTKIWTVLSSGEYSTVYFVMDQRNVWAQQFLFLSALFHRNVFFFNSSFDLLVHSSVNITQALLFVFVFVHSHCCIYVYCVVCM